jgi:hypothetical protein
MAKSLYPAINIQWPISQLLITGEKLIETRTYPIPSKYLNTELLLVETPGKKGNFKARIIGIIKFSDCFKYQNSAEFYQDYENHRVTRESPWAWSKSKKKWGWRVCKVMALKKPLAAPPNRGILFTKKIPLSDRLLVGL